MSALPVEAHGRPRLDPFAFASDTTLRFILLFVFVIAADIQRWHGVAVRGFDLGTRWKECVSGAPLIGAELLDTAKMQECSGPVLSYDIPVILGGLLLLAAVTGAIYWYYPVWIVRRQGLTPLDPADAPELFATLQKLCNTAGLRHQPEFWWNPVSGSNFPLAFGRARVYRVGFSGALAVQHTTDQAAFRAIMLHELAHIRNGDVWKTYMALSLGWGFLLAALLPYLVVAVSRQMDVADAVVLLVEMAMAAGVVLLTLIAVLRARELYADARSFLWGRDEETLRARPEIIESTSDRVNIGFTTVFSYHIWWS
jgi:Zn-dependent protease with chaperone function